MKRNENGRSMIEMLGVLAIIGVLSVGGIYGYSTAMFRHRVNEIVQTASSLAMLARSGSAGTGTDLSLSSTSLSSKPGGVNLDMLACVGPNDTSDILIKIKFIGITADEADKYGAAMENINSADSGVVYDYGIGDLDCDED